MLPLFQILVAAASLSFASLAAAAAAGPAPDLTTSGAGVLAVVVFIAAYGMVIGEEFSQLRKSKPVIVAAGAIWVLVALAYAARGEAAAAAQLLRANLLEYAELMLFLLAAMTFINTLEERNLFKALRSWMVSSGFSLRAIYWLTGLLAFFVSPFADNLTTALVMAAVVLAVAPENKRFIAVSCINIVVAANAGGAFSPFGDITTLMVWQKGVVRFEEFFALFVPSLVNWLAPAACMAFAVDKGRPPAHGERVTVKFGGYAVVALFLGTIALTVGMHHFLHLPPFLGMMTGLGLLKVYGYFIRRDELRNQPAIPEPDTEAFNWREYYKPAVKPFDIFISMKRVEWDTLMFFYGVVLCVGGLGALGYLALLSTSLYQGLGATSANVLIGIASAVIDNIPIMYAVLSMNPDMPHGQWLLVTLTAGVGGSLLSIGSAAGVALMGQARGVYTFFAHLKWTWAVALGYAASIWVHFLINARLF
ncbi:MAG: sodium:proton antiporter [Candidatus Muproteobacteria bacterium RIFCSPHIGHO2_01_FULL_65_16]|uniref:Sodium:proton antiporter n=1 Tax=Candidatus Muproteobacteria bacterium RIFCSPHIGHO2_01_FULL_65_16 TaxID=1817764 RepID=A0A1F6TKQ1_9PROT|nr:MAG: sodium:proton antiporter [Candidatus Muproteobacteria bacterium RIFCSPHIGHO2_01_FULL_65_16]